MRVLVTGSNGQLGHDMLLCLSSHNIDCLGVDKGDFDLTESEVTAQFIQEYKPDVLIHCAAYTNVDLAENEVEKCYALNVDATANIAHQCELIGSKLVYISTDYIFSGESLGPHETDSRAEPLSVYGNTKFQGEKQIQAHTDKYFIVRTSWSFGMNGSNFVNTMLRLGHEKETVDVVCDQVGSPTYTRDLAECIVEMIQTTNYGIYHATNEGCCSWAEFAVEIFKQSGLKTKVNFITSDEFPSLVKRPKNSILSKKSLIEGNFKYLPDWKDGLKRYLAELGAGNK